MIDVGDNYIRVEDSKIVKTYLFKIKVSTTSGISVDWPVSGQYKFIVTAASVSCAGNEISLTANEEILITND